MARLKARTVPPTCASWMWGTAAGRVGQVAPDLVHPQPVRNRCDAGDLHLPRRQLDEEQHHEALQSASRPRFDGEEVGGNDQIPVLLEELLPGSLSFPLRRWLNSVPRQDLSDRARPMSCPRLASAPWIRR